MTGNTAGDSPSLAGLSMLAAQFNGLCYSFAVAINHLPSCRQSVKYSSQSASITDPVAHGNSRVSVKTASPKFWITFQVSGVGGRGGSP